MEEVDKEIMIAKFQGVGTDELQIKKSHRGFMGWIRKKLHTWTY